MNKKQFDELVEKLNTQDNRSTSHPLFQVQQVRRINGVDSDFHAVKDDNHYWRNLETGEITENDKELKENYFADEDIDLRSDILETHFHRFRKIHYIEIYEFVSAHFTEKAAQSYIDNNRHNLDKPCIYVSSQYRCHEWNAVVEALKAGKLILKGEKEEQANHENSRLPY